MFWVSFPVCTLNCDKIVCFVVNINPWIPKASQRPWQRREGRDVLICWVKSIWNVGNHLKHSTEGGPHRPCHSISLNSLQLRKYSRGAPWFVADSFFLGRTCAAQCARLKGCVCWGTGCNQITPRPWWHLGYLAWWFFCQNFINRLKEQYCYQAGAMSFMTFKEAAGASFSKSLRIFLYVLCVVLCLHHLFCFFKVVLSTVFHSLALFPNWLLWACRYEWQSKLSLGFDGNKLSEVPKPHLTRQKVETLWVVGWCKVEREVWAVVFLFLSQSLA